MIERLLLHILKSDLHTDIGKTYKNTVVNIERNQRPVLHVVCDGQHVCSVQVMPWVIWSLLSGQTTQSSIKVENARRTQYGGLDLLRLGNLIFSLHNPSDGDGSIMVGGLHSTIDGSAIKLETSDAYGILYAKGTTEEGT